MLARLGIIKIGGEILNTAARLDTKELGSLDAIHLSTALSLGKQPGGVVVYEVHLAEAAEAGGLPVLAPRERA